MKLLTAAMAVSLLFLGSCKKDKANSTILTGSWEIRSAQTSIIPTISFPPGNDSILKFTATTYLLYSKGSLMKSGIYTIVDDSNFDGPPGQFTHRIIYDGDTTLKKFFKVTGTTLTFAWGIFELDGGSIVQYERVPEM
jgi:hypothetical protein